MEFVWMKHAGVSDAAKVPVTAVPHWEGNGWEKTDPPAKPQRRTKTYTPPAVATVEQMAGAATEALDTTETSTESPVDTRASAKPKTTKAAPAGRKED